MSIFGHILSSTGRQTGRGGRVFKSTAKLSLSNPNESFHRKIISQRLDRQRKKLTSKLYGMTHLHHRNTETPESRQEGSAGKNPGTFQQLNSSSLSQEDSSQGRLARRRHRKKSSESCQLRPPQYLLRGISLDGWHSVWSVANCIIQITETRYGDYFIGRSEASRLATTIFISTRECRIRGDEEGEVFKNVFLEVLSFLSL